MFIYYIQNNYNNNVYIGQTIRDCTNRKREHFVALSNNRHYNQYLQNAWNKYGEDYFEFGVIEKDFKTIDELNEAEEFWITTLKTLRPYGYNLTTGAGNFRRSQDNIDKLIKPVYQYDLDGNFIREWKRASLPAKKYDVWSTSIVNCCNGLVKSVSEYQWRYEKKDKIEKYKVKELTPETRYAIGSPNRGSSPEGKWKESIIESNKEREWTDEAKLKIAQANKERVWTEEAREKLSKAHRGSNSAVSKLTEDIVLEIRYRYEHENITQRELSKDYPVNSRSISNIINRKTWTHI